jgi:hypothetical protein
VSSRTYQKARISSFCDAVSKEWHSNTLDVMHPYLRCIARLTNVLDQDALKQLYMRATDIYKMRHCQANYATFTARSHHQANTDFEG